MIDQIVAQPIILQVCLLPSLPSIFQVLCSHGGAFVVKGLPWGGEFVIYEFIIFHIL